MAHPSSGGSRFRPSPWLLLWFLLAAPLAPGQTGPVRDIFPDPAPPVTFNGKLYFAASSAATGLELYRSDLGGNNQELVRDIRPGAANGVRYGDGMALVIGSTLYFVASEGAGGFELWKTDGTAAGTVRVKDIHPGAGDSSPLWLTNVNGTLYFTADNGTDGRELWKSNGTAAGTTLVKNIVADPSGEAPQYLANLNGTLYFGLGDALWKSNGTAAGTVVVKAGIAPAYLTPFN
ncbi:MAG: hypothetical protein ICV83_14235, partial [Cytophagales bacterium]|nr:hypothetical protein [Cytophagales bacterium]